MDHDAKPAIADVVDAIVALQRQLAADDHEDPPGAPAAPPPLAAIEAVEVRHARALPPDYRGFLARHDGWPGFEWGLVLRSTAELTDGYDRGYLDDTDDPIPPELAEALVIGHSENDATLVLLLADGAVVDWKYEELDRAADVGAWLAGHRELLVERLDHTRATRAAVAAEWTAAARAEREAALAAELATRVVATAPFVAPDLPPPSEPLPPPLDPAALVARDDGEITAELTLALTLYLGASPSPDEIVRGFRAFRARFPVAGALAWTPARLYFFGLLKHDDDPDAEPFVPDLTVEGTGHFGLRATITPTGGGRPYLFNLRHVPPASAAPEVLRASFCEVIVPFDASSDALAGLAADLLEILPVRSGHGGPYALLHAERDAEATAAIFAWARRGFGIDVGPVDGWLPATLTHVRGAAWLTVLGPTFTAAIGDRVTALPGVDVVHAGGGVVLRAGATPPLGDHARGEFPEAIARVAHALAPWTASRYAPVGTIYLAGHAFTTHRDELPPFEDHRATAAFMERFVQPRRWLAPTARDEGVALLERLGAMGDDGARWLAEWASPRGGRSFDTLLRLLFSASCHDLASDLAVEALELATRHEGGQLERAMNNLLIAYQRRGELDRARALIPRALVHADRNPHILHAAACVHARSGELEQALALCVRAGELGYQRLDALRTDDDLAALRGVPAFESLFGAITPTAG